MIRTSFDDGWTFGPRKTIFEHIGGGSPGEPVTLPHDAMLHEGRGADSPNGSHTGYFRPGAWEYEKQLEVPAAWADRRATLEFEGVYRDAMVYVDGHLAGQWSNGYSTFYVPLDPYLTYGGTATVRVEAQAYKDSRWYSGGGIHRPVSLLLGGLVHIAAEGPQITTPDVDQDLATVAVATRVLNESTATRTVRLRATVTDGAGAQVATDDTRLTILAGEALTARLRLYVPHPALWSVEHPALYTATVEVLDGTHEPDAHTTAFGIRTVTVDPSRGLRINGEVVKLRGACVHHDNGVLGSAAIGRAEERRVELLRAAGFNAIRSAHNPMSRAMLDACDRLGMLVMDETFDMWTVSKTEDDYARRFPQWWERDVDALVTKDLNHPSVILYSIGNEILEIGTPFGARVGRLVAERIRAADPTRLVTNAINGGMTAMELMPALLAEAQAAGAAGGPDPSFNSALGEMGDAMERLIASDQVGERIVEASSYLDVVGLNYAHARYLPDHAEFPGRVVVGSETFPSIIDRYWQLVLDNDHVIGDFTWTGWDYLGEAGIGRPMRPGDDQGLSAGYPWLTAGAGDIDITGLRRAVSYYRATVFGLSDVPYLATQPPAHRETPARPRSWSWSEAVPSWTWDVAEGTPVTVEVYSDAEEIELLLDGAPVVRVPVGTERPCYAEAVVPYRRGTITSVAHRGGREVGRTSLATADPALRVELSVDRDVLAAGPWDLAHVEIRLVDQLGRVDPGARREVTVQVDGPGTLQGLGSARPDPRESYLGDRCTSDAGRALAVVRPTGPGTLTVTVQAEGCAPARCVLLVDGADRVPASAPVR
ncbi:MAG TPA: glycoside hydrolase family 2 TIM barrel-domain containing protein [Cellulomonas sp.]